MSDPLLEAQLVRHEGLRLKPYRDSMGKLTLGVGRNLDDVGVTQAEALVLLRGDIARTQAGLDGRLAWWRGLDPVRARALTDMAFNLGVAGLLRFDQTLAALEAGDYAAAADHMLASRWAGQVKVRAQALAAMIRTGCDPAQVAP